MIGFKCSMVLQVEKSKSPKSLFTLAKYAASEKQEVMLRSQTAFGVRTEQITRVGDLQERAFGPTL